MTAQDRLRLGLGGGDLLICDAHQKEGVKERMRSAPVGMATSGREVSAVRRCWGRPTRRALGPPAHLVHCPAPDRTAPPLPHSKRVSNVPKAPREGEGTSSLSHLL